MDSPGLSWLTEPIDLVSIALVIFIANIYIFVMMGWSGINSILKRRD
jgi:hypothetical protein